MKIENQTYSLGEVAESHLFISKRELICWLRRYNIINGMKASPEFILQGYFVQHKKIISRENFKKEVDILLITSKGIKFLEKLRSVLKMSILNFV